MISRKTLSNICFVLLILLICDFGSATNASSQAFEGVIHYQIPELKDQIGTTRLDYMIKKNMIRIEYKSGGSHTTSLLYEEHNKTMYLNLSSLGGYVEVPPNDIKKNINHKNVQFTSTGTTKTIAGHRCSVSEASLDGSTYQYCFASGMGNFILPVNSMTAGSVPQWASFKFPDGQLPLQVIRKENGKNDKTMMTTTKIEEKKLNRNLFSVFN